MDRNPYEPPRSSLETVSPPTVPADGNLTIAYDNTFSDFLAFARHTHHRTLRNQKYFTIAVTGIMVFGLCLSLAPDIVGFVASFFGALGFTAVFGVLYHLVHGYFFERYIRKMLMAGSTEGVFGRHELELDGAYLTERTHVNEMRHALSALDRIEVSEEHVFVYVTSIHGHIIPKRGVVVGDADQFIQRLRELVTDARK